MRLISIRGGGGRGGTCALVRECSRGAGRRSAARGLEWQCTHDDNDEQQAASKLRWLTIESAGMRHCAAIGRWIHPSVRESGATPRRPRVLTHFSSQRVMCLNATLGAHLQEAFAYVHSTAFPLRASKLTATRIVPTRRGKFIFGAPRPPQH